MRHKFFSVDYEVLQELLYFYTEEGYFAWFFENCSQYPSYRSAFNAIESEYFMWFKKYKFKNYEQFRVAKYRYLYKILNKK